jgi:CRISPR system Cascade subunit CasE
MHLTQFEINPARRGAQKLLGSPQAMHAAVLAGFPGDDADRGRILWRVDAGPRHTYLYVSSVRRPDLTHLVEQAGWPTTSTWSTGDLGALLDSLTVDQEWSFRLTANPTRSTRVGDRERSQRVGCVTAQHQLDWFLARTAKWGVRIPATEGRPDAVVNRRDVRSFRRQEGRVTVTMATFDGRLEVVDPDLLRTAMVDGIGPAKAYGCGLLTLAPVDRR